MPDTLAQNFETATAGELVAAIAAKRVSALELTEATIARIERINPPLNAVVVKDYDRAREAAKAVDARVAKGERAPLLGVPMTVKESHKVAGLPTTWGIADNAGYVPDQDSTVISRLKNAGAIIVGKTNVPPNLGDWISDNPIYGRTNNPHNLGYSPGGSSGGGAAAVASGMVPIEVGTDIGGSIRIPAAFCGIHGLKTTANVVPGFDHAPPGFDGAGQSLSVLGPLARTPDDLDLVFSVIAGPAGDEAVGYTFANRAPRHAALRDFRVLILDRHPLAQVDREIVEALHALAAKVERAGAKVARKTDLLPDLAAAHQSYASMLGTIMSRRSGASNTVSAHDFLNLIDDQFRLRRAWRQLFEDFDIVLAPIFGTASFPHPTETGWGKRFLTIDGKPTPYGAQIAWQGVVTFPGLPACAMPIATSKTGLPVGVQAIGPMYEDLTTTQFARLVARLAAGAA